MFFLLFLTISGAFGIENSTLKDYFSVQSEEFIVGPKVGPFALIIGANKWPSFIDYVLEIDNESGIKITVGFSKPNNSLDYDFYLIRDMNLCDVLDGAIDDPKSPESQFMIPEMLGLYGVKCPISKGLRNLNPYKFPTLSKIKDIGTGVKNFIINISDKNNSNMSIITLVAPVKMEYWNAETQGSSKHDKIKFVVGTPTNPLYADCEIRWED
ncbi:hypothetical protein PV327_005608 [Microctonus hyperodae]|uniref:Uncharacterized protein n=1 Tax=Microctonus hyperodae TaxID=165561 RepID=A0AA39KZV4_MICHY|nr:hypothetical protein PV327_005608 [Microctonus hyperodae]